jgi:hypothetical protein
MSPASVRLPTHDEAAAPVTILDGSGQVLRTVTAQEFRRDHGTSEPPTLESWRPRRGRAKVRDIRPDAIEQAAAS